MHFSKRTIALSIAAGVCLVVFAILMARIFLFGPFTVALYGLDPREAKAVETACRSYGTMGKGNAPRVVAIEKGRSLASVLQPRAKPDLIVFEPGGESTAAVRSFVAMPADRQGLFSTTLRWAGSSGNTWYAAPLFLDHLELAWNAGAFATAKLAVPTGISALEKAGAYFVKRKPTIPILIAGGEDEVLIDVVGQLLANRYGAAAYDSLASLLSKQRDFAKVISSPLAAEGSSGPTTLAETLGIFIGWTNK